VKLSPEALAATPNALAADYSRFGVAGRLLLSGHSHQAWPDVAFDGQLEAIEDAASLVDEKWQRAFERAERVRQGVRALLADPRAEIALGASTHDLLVRLLSALPWSQRGRVLTSDGEFHSLRRQLARLEEAGIEVRRLAADDPDTLADRLARAVDDRVAAVFVSAVLYENARIVPGLDALARACERFGAELVVDAYHALGALPFRVHELGLGGAWVVGGGYKYLQLGEGNAFLRVPASGLGMRPVVTGWYAEFDRLETGADLARVGYPQGAARFAGATYDPTSHYRAARVLDFFVRRGLDDDLLRAVSRRQVARLAARFDALGLPEAVATRDRVTPAQRFGGFLALDSPHAGALHRELRRSGVSCDFRGDRLRLGPAPYLADSQLDAAIDALGEAAGSLT
jgi:kynureninase